MLELKQLHTDSFAAIVAFDRLCFPTDHWKEADWAELLADPRAIYYAYLDDETIAGSVFIYNWMGEKDYVKIMNIAVHPYHRNQGLAQKLLNHVTSEMMPLHMRRFCGETRATNRAMQRTFEHCGYALNTVEEGYYDNPTEAAYKYLLVI